MIYYLQHFLITFIIPPYLIILGGKFTLTFVAIGIHFLYKDDVMFPLMPRFPLIRVTAFHDPSSFFRTIQM